MKMNQVKHSTHNRRTSLMACALLLVIGFLSLEAQPDASADLRQIVIRKKLLLSKLDSLELAKQLRKREGHSLHELEKQSGAVKQSIESLRVQLARAAENGRFPDQATGKKATNLKKFLPQTAFDWAIAGIGAVAVLCVCVAIIGVVQIARSKKSRARKRSASAAPKPAVPPPELPRPYTAQSSAAVDTDENDGVEALRRLVRTDTAAAPESREPVVPDHAPSQDVQPASGEAESSLSGGDIREQVLASARTGTNPREIARRLHLSYDQVRLIMRMADDHRAS
jgi:hypothetical protein